MKTSTVRKSGLAAASAAALIAVGMPLALAVPAAVPPSDGSGYVDSTARCTAPDTAVLFGTTKTSRVAICKTSNGSYEYRGVRVADGAKLIASAKQTSGTTFVVDNNGVKYTVTPTALSVTANGDTFRTETWTDFHGQQSGSTSSSTSTAAKPTTSGTSAPSTSTAPSKSSTASATPSSTAPLPPPLPAEVGAATSDE
jgi:hypothetical protein